MKRSIALATLLLLAVPAGRAAADIVDTPIAVSPDQIAVRGRQVFISVVAVDTPPTTRSQRASLIIYKPDGTVLTPRRRYLHNSTAVFRVPLGSLPPLGSYTVFATVEIDKQAFGMPTTFDVVE